MTACSACGGPVDPDTIHIQHGSGACDGDWGPGGCDCPEVCAACCSDPDCPTRVKVTHLTPDDLAAAQEAIDWGDRIEIIRIPSSDDVPDCPLEETTVTDPKPLTDDELVALKALLADDVKLSLVLTRRLVALVEQTRKERDDARAALLELLDKPRGLWSDVVPRAIRRARATTEEPSR